MESEQYEELCRRFIAEQVGVPVEDVKSVTVPTPTRPGLPEYKHQIDLYWETGDSIATYVNVANAKWRGAAKIDQGDLLLLQKVREEIKAHKAVMITNVGFTSGATAVAKEHRIALHVVTPSLDLGALPRGDRRAIAEKLQDLASTQTLYSHSVEHRAFDFGETPSHTSIAPSPPRSPAVGYETRVIQPASQPATPPSVNRSIGGSETRGGLGPSAGSRVGGGPFKK